MMLFVDDFVRGGALDGDFSSSGANDSKWCSISYHVQNITINNYLCVNI